MSIFPDWLNISTSGEVEFVEGLALQIVADEMSLTLESNDLILTIEDDSLALEIE